MVIDCVIASLDSNAREICIDLEERFGYSSFAQLYSLQELASFAQQGQNVTDYFIKMKTVWDEVDHLGSLPRCKYNDCMWIN